MAETNGNSWIVRTLIGFLFTITFFGITALANNMILNDKCYRESDNEIIKEHRADVTKIREEIHNNQIAMMRTQQIQMNMITKIATKLDV